MPIVPYKLDVGFNPAPLGGKPRLPVFTPAVEPERPGGGFLQIGENWKQMVDEAEGAWEVLGLAGSQFNDVANAVEFLSRPVFDFDPNFDLVANLKAAELWDDPDERHAYLGTASAAEFLWLLRKRTKQQRERELLAAAGAGGVVASMLMSVLSPTILLPFIGAAKGARAIGVGAAWGLGAGIISEVPLQLNQEFRTLEESTIDVAFSTILGGVLGGAVGSMRAGALKRIEADMDPARRAQTISPLQEKKLIEDTIKELEARQAAGKISEADLPHVTETVTQYTRRLDELNELERRIANDDEVSAALGRPVAVGADVADLSPGGLKNTFGIAERIRHLAGPPVANLAQRISSAARKWQPEISTSGLRLERNVILDKNGNVVGGIPTASGQGTLENIIGYRRGEVLELVTKGYENYENYWYGSGNRPKMFPSQRAFVDRTLKFGKSGKMNRQQFFEAVGRAMFAGDAHEIPEVALTAKQFRTYYDKLLAEAQEAGIIPREIKQIAPDLSFMNRVYDQVAISRNPTKFMNMLANHFENSLRSEVARIEAVEATANARDLQRLADMDLPLPEAQRLLGEYRKELAIIDKADGEEGLAIFEELMSENRAKLADNTRARKAVEEELRNGPQNKEFRNPRIAEVERLQSERQGLQNEILAWKELGGADLEARATRRAELKRRIRSLNRSKFMVEEKQRAKYEKIEDLEEANLEALHRAAQAGVKAKAASEAGGDAFEKELGNLRSALTKAQAAATKLQNQVEGLQEAAAGAAEKEAKTVAEPQTIVIHGGADFEDIDPKKFGSGEPGGIRPLGNGLYTFEVDPGNPEEALRAIDYARHFSNKYGKGKKTLHGFSVPHSATAMWNGPKAGPFKEGWSPEERTWLDALQAANEIPPGPERKAAFAAAHELEEAAKANPGNFQLRGERLPINLTELSILDPKIAKRVGKFDLEVSNEDILKQLTESAAKKPDKSEALFARLFKTEEKFATSTERYNEILDELEALENINWAERGRADAERLIQEALDASLERVNRVNTARAKRMAALEKQAEKFDQPAWEAHRQAIVDRMAARRTRNADRIREMGGDNPKQRAMEIAQVAKERITGANLRLPGFDAMSDARGTELARALSMPSLPLADAGFLVTDAEQLLHVYANTLISDTEIVKRLGPFAPDGSRNVMFRELNEEQTSVTMRAEIELRQKMEAEAAKKGKPFDEAKYEQKRGDLARSIDKEYRVIHENFEAQLLRLRHQWGVVNPDHWLTRGTQIFLAAQGLRLLGTVGISSIPDLAKPVMRYGFGRTFMKAWIPYITSIHNMKLSHREAQLAFVGVEVKTSDRAFQVAELMHLAQRQSKFEAALKWTTSKMGIIALYAPWTDTMKVISTMSMTSKMMDSIELARGFAKGSKKELAEATEFLNSLSIDEGMQRRIWDQMQNGGAEKHKGAWIPQTEKWTDEEAVRMMRQAIFGEASASVITPGLEIPKVVNKTLAGKLLFNLKSFALASVSKTVLAGMQQRDAAVLNAVLLSMALGYLSYYLRSVATGGETYQRFLNASNEQRIDEALDASGLLGIFSNFQRIAQDLPYLRNVASVSGVSSMIQGKPQEQTMRAAGGGLLEDLGGPSVSALFTLASALTGLEGEDFNRSTVHKLRQLLPLQNVFYLRRLFDQLENVIGDWRNLEGRRR